MAATPRGSRAERGRGASLQAEVTNLRIAARLEEFSALLELSGAGYYSARAYRRAAELVRAAPVDGRHARAGRPSPRAAGHRARDRGAGCASWSRRATSPSSPSSGESTPLELAAFGRFSASGRSARSRSARRSGSRRWRSSAQAARQGRLREVPGIGDEDEPRRSSPRSSRSARSAAARPAPPARPRSSPRRSPTALGGIAAGDARRWMDVPTRLAVVVPSDDPDAVRGALRGAARDRRPARPRHRHHRRRRSGRARRRAGRERSGRRSSGPPGRPSTSPRSARSRPRPTRTSVYRRLGSRAARRPRSAMRGPSASRRALVELGEIRGDLHAHTTWSDGRATVLEMGAAARDRGYEYLAICDHTPGVTRRRRASTPTRSAGRARRSPRPTSSSRRSGSCAASSATSAPDGTLDLPDDVLAELDWVQLSLHRGPARAARRADRARHRGHAPPGGALPQPPDRAA